MFSFSLARQIDLNNKWNVHKIVKEYWEDDIIQGVMRFHLSCIKEHSNSKKEPCNSFIKGFATLPNIKYISLYKGLKVSKKKYGLK